MREAMTEVVNWSSVASVLPPFPLTAPLTRFTAAPLPPNSTTQHALLLVDPKMRIRHISHYEEGGGRRGRRGLWLGGTAEFKNALSASNIRLYIDNAFPLRWSSLQTTARRTSSSHYSPRRAIYDNPNAFAGIIAPETGMQRACGSTRGFAQGQRRYSRIEKQTSIYLEQKLRDKRDKNPWSRRGQDPRYAESRSTEAHFESLSGNLGSQRQRNGRCCRSLDKQADLFAHRTKTPFTFTQIAQQARGDREVFGSLDDTVERGEGSSRHESFGTGYGGNKGGERESKRDSTKDREKDKGRGLMNGSSFALSFTSSLLLLLAPGLRFHRHLRSTSPPLPLLVVLIRSVLTRCSLIRFSLQFNLETDSDLRYKNVSQSYSQQASTSSAPPPLEIQVLLQVPESNSKGVMIGLTKLSHGVVQDSIARLAQSYSNQIMALHHHRDDTVAVNFIATGILATSPL
ncbi:hypothetical protein C8J56DRAFT_1130824 [Mycena floridula]|nr:hypothetical protein C8J56DRAFT_1130824 [Mycena floridula]